VHLIVFQNPSTLSHFFIHVSQRKSYANYQAPPKE
jgi:hypothetical protein